MKRILSPSLELEESGTIVDEPVGLLCIHFWSAAKEPYYRLSNLYAAPIHFKGDHVPPAFPNRDLLVAWLGEGGQHFASSEHVWQALKAKDEKTFLDFTTTGELGGGNLLSFFNFLCLTQEAIKKAKFWGAKNMVGITAKLAVSPRHRKKLDLLHRIEDKLELLAPDVERAIWIAILEQKFKQNSELADLLKSTGDAMLVEFDRSTRNPLRSGSPPHWGGWYDKENRQVVGENVMGLYMMAVRDLLRT